MKRKRVIRLTEHDLHNFVKKCIRNILNESDWAMDPNMEKYYKKYYDRLNGININPYKRKYYTKQELESAIAKAQEKLDNGESVYNVFDRVFHVEKGFYIVKIDDKYNVVDNNNKLLFDEWFDDIKDDIIINNHFIVKKNGKIGFIDINGNLLYNIWFDKIKTSSYKKGVIVCLNNKYNILDENSDFMFNQWFDDIRYDFINNEIEGLIKGEWYVVKN